MACAACSEDNADVRMACKVCQLVSNDNTIKRVKYCKTCGAYICEAHRRDYALRGFAAIKSLFVKTT